MFYLLERVPCLQVFLAVQRCTPEDVKIQNKVFGWGCQYNLDYLILGWKFIFTFSSPKA